ncbi:MAG TPA: 2-polyprenylphenol 6-hydroxylase [Deltaproteobacteria bacterium]|nr:2-polyprenylphenol 6-hydroxylase [Deltaproteobacteria bacterium]
MKISRVRRLHKIVATLTGYGFGGLVSELRIFPFLPLFERVLLRRKEAGLPTAVRIRLVLEELGPTFIKLGQVASTRADFLPSDWVEELKKLQDMVPPVPFDEVKAVVERSLEGPLEEKFRSFEAEPVASASIAQVHYATLHDGSEVAVKVRRPGIGETIESDLAVMWLVADLLVKYVPQARRYRPREVVREFSRVIHSEQDFTVEGAHANRFARMFEGDPTVRIPKVYWKLTTAEVLTLERISGVPIDEVEELKRRGHDVKKVSVNGIKAFFKQVFEHGVFHADLHPGNIFVGDDGVIIYLDFGIVGRLDRELKTYLATMLFHLVREDYRRMAIVHRQMGLIGRDVDLDEFEDALRDIAEPIFGKSLEEIKISALLMKLIRTARRFNMRLQPNLLLLQKSMVIIEGVGRQLYPDINMWEVARPLIYKWMVREKFSPKKALEKGRDYAGELVDAAIELPGSVNSLVRAAVDEELRIGFVHHRLEGLSDEIGGAGRRIEKGLVTAALLVGAFMAGVFSGPDAPRLAGVPLLSLAGFAAAVLFRHLAGRWERGGDEV